MRFAVVFKNRIEFIMKKRVLSLLCVIGLLYTVQCLGVWQEMKAWYFNRSWHSKALMYGGASQLIREGLGCAREKQRQETTQSLMTRMKASFSSYTIFCCLEAAYMNIQMRIMNDAACAQHDKGNNARRNASVRKLGPAALMGIEVGKQFAVQAVTAGVKEVAYQTGITDRLGDLYKKVTDRVGRPYPFIERCVCAAGTTLLSASIMRTINSFDSTLRPSQRQDWGFAWMIRMYGDE